MKKVFCLLSLAAVSQAAAAQTPCPAPQLLLNGELAQTSAANAFAPLVLALQSNPACAAETYEIKAVEVSFVRGRQPLRPTKRVAGATLDLAEWQALYQPGDRLYIEVKEAAVVDNKGTKKSYAGEPITYNWVVK